MSIPIEFLAMEENLQKLPRPHPANREVPEWLKQMPMDRSNLQVTEGTVKRCPPFLEAMTAGYIIPVPCDCKFEIDAFGRVQAESKYQLLSSHEYMQYQGAPFEKTLVLKFRNPWIVRTPPGYSCLFIAPI